MTEEPGELPFPELVVQLRALVGVRLVAYVGNVTSTRSVSDWATGQSSPVADDEARLRLAYRVARLLSECADPVTIQSWLMGENPTLGDEAPARYIQTHDPVDAEREVMAAVSVFVA